METLNIIDDKNIEIISTTENKLIYNYDALIARKTDLESQLSEIDRLISKFPK
jgi:hypothetical protein